MPDHHVGDRRLGVVAHFTILPIPLAVNNNGAIAAGIFDNLTSWRPCKTGERFRGTMTFDQGSRPRYNT